MKFILIRHGKTKGNLERRYIGCRTDEDLCAGGIADLGLYCGPVPDIVFTSPMKRCIQTAELLFPGKPVRIVDNLRECDFGAFEGRNFEELKDHSEYRKWLESGGNTAFPGGESRRDFTERCVKAFTDTIRDLPDGNYAFVVHGGTIMAVMEHFAGGDYYDYQAGNGEGFILQKNGAYEVLHAQ